MNFTSVYDISGGWGRGQSKNLLIGLTLFGVSQKERGRTNRQNCNTIYRLLGLL